MFNLFKKTPSPEVIKEMEDSLLPQLDAKIKMFLDKIAKASNDGNTVSVFFCAYLLLRHNCMEVIAHGKASDFQMAIGVLLSEVEDTKLIDEFMDMVQSGIDSAMEELDKKYS